MAPFEVIYKRRCISSNGWFEVGECALIGPEGIYESIKKVRLIRDRLNMAQSRKKYYVNNKKMNLEFMVGDLAYLKISPMKGVMRFRKKGKLSPLHMGPYEILKCIRLVPMSLNYLLCWLRCIQCSMYQCSKSAFAIQCLFRS